LLQKTYSPLPPGRLETDGLIEMAKASALINQKAPVTPSHIAGSATGAFFLLAIPMQDCSAQIQLPI